MKSIMDNLTKALDMNPLVVEEEKITSYSDDKLVSCYKCGTPLLNASGIGLFCPNKECDVSDGVLGEEPIFTQTELPAVDLTDEPTQILAVEELVPVEEPKDQSEEDFELARRNLQELAKKGNKALDELILLAKNSEHPRAYEVVATLIKTLADTNKDLLDTRKKKLDIDKARGVVKTDEGKTITNNNLFVGSTAELQKFLKERAKTLEHDE